MSSERREKISFVAKKSAPKPTKVNFYTKSGEKVSFRASKNVSSPTKVEFYAKKKK